MFHFYCRYAANVGYLHPHANHEDSTLEDELRNAKNNEENSPRQLLQLALMMVRIL